MDIYISLRRLAKSNKYQTLFNFSKELNISFLSKEDYTDIQIIFMRYLNMYSIINEDIANNEVDEFVLKDNVYEDAYMYYRSKQNNKKIDLTQKQKLNTQKVDVDVLKTFKWNLNK